MEKTDPNTLDSVALLFENVEDVEVKSKSCDVGEGSSMSEGTTKHNGTGISAHFDNERMTEDFNDDQAQYAQRKRSYSLREQEQGEKEEKYVHVRQRTHPRRRRSERRRTLRSGLNLLMPRNDLEKEDSSDTKDDTDMASDEVNTTDVAQVCAEAPDQCTNDERINLTTTAGTSKNGDLNDQRITLDAENIGDISSANNELTPSDDTKITLENTSIDPDCINENSSVIPGVGKAYCAGRRDENVTTYDKVSADSTTDSSSPESESVSSSSPPPLPPGPPPDASLLRKESFAIVGTRGKHARVTGAGNPANFADQLISALSSAAVDESNDPDDSGTSSQLGPSTHNALQKIQPDSPPKSPRGELELPTSSSSSAKGSLASIFNGLFGIPKEVTQPSQNLLDDVNNRCTSFSKSETCLLNLSGAAQIKSRGRRINIVGQTGSKTFLATDTEHTSEIRALDSSADRVQSTNGMKLAFSTSCLADTTIDSEFLHFIQKEARINEPADVVDAVNDVDFMSPAERNEFEEFCDTFCDEEPEELLSDPRSIENEDPTQTLIKHLLEKPLEQTAVEPSTIPPDDHTFNIETSEHCSRISTLDGVEISSSRDKTPQLDSMFSIVPSALLSPRPLSFVRMTSLTEDEVDNSTHQNLPDESNARANKDYMTLSLSSSTNASSDIFAPPLPPKSASFRQTRESLKIELSERRGRSLNLEDDRKSNSPPPLPPRRGSSLVISGTPEMIQRLPPSTTITKLSSIAGTPNGDNAQTIPVYRTPNCPRQLRDRNCISSIIPDNEILSPVEKNNSSDPNLSTTTIFSPDPPELPPRNGNFPSVEHSHSNQVQEPFTHVPPPRPPPFFRSMSTREGGMEKAAAFVMSSQSHRSCGRTLSLKNYGDQLADKEWIEARNEMMDIEIITSLASSSIPPLDPCPEPPFQHFPVKLDGTHHRLSLVSSSSSECHPSLQSHSNGAFLLTGDEKLELADPRSDAQSIKQKLLRQKSSSSSDTDCSRMFNSASRTSSTNTSGRRREKFLAGLKGEGTTTSSVNLLSNEAPVPSDGTMQLGASSFYDLSADNHAFVRDRQDSTISSTYDEKMPEDLSQVTRSRRMAKRISNVYSAVGWSSRKKEDKKTAKSKEIPFRSMMARFPFLRETSVRGVPSDLNTLMDSALSLNDYDGYNEGSNLKIQSGPRKQEVGREQRSRSFFGEEILRKDYVVPEPSSSPRYSAGMADQMRMMMMVDEVDDPNKQEANNNSNQKNSEKIILALDSLKRDMIEYTTVLESLQKTYEEMRSKTPDGIRQRFDLAFKEVKVMHQLQLELNSWIIKDNVDLSVVAEAFKTKDFSTYKRYSILARDLQKEIKSHSSYFNENFEKFSLNIMKPFHRLNTYSLYLQSFQNNYLDETESKLQEAVSYLNNLKQEANTEMNICDMQKCPVELRLAGLISHSGHLHHDGDLLPKQVYVILFESILVICEDNHDYRVYKQHYRSEQVSEIREGGELEIEIKVHPTFQSDTIQLKFKANLTSERKTWMMRLQAWQERNRPSFKTIILNSDLQRNIHLKHDRFLPLSLWMLSPSLKETIDTVKHNRVGEKTIKLNKIHNISRPNSGEDAIFNSFMVNVEDFASRLDVLLDQEARAPPQLLGSILRKMRRFYKSVFLPQLRADFEKQPDRILKSIVGNLPNFPPLFREYIEVRSGLTLMMEDGLNCNQYISPFKHLSFFIEWLFTLSCIAKYHVKLRGQLAILVNCVEDARVTLLHSAIVNCQLDFYKTGDIVRNGNLESKVKCRSVKGNQDYHVILFEKAILFTRAKIPQYEYVQILWLDQITFGPQPDHKCSFRLEERGTKKIYVYELKAKDELQKKEWQNSIHKQLHRQVEFVKKNLS